MMTRSIHPIAWLAAAALAAAGPGCRGEGSPAPGARPGEAPAPGAPSPAAPAPQPAPQPAAATAVAPAGPPSAAYKSDIEKLCDVVRLSGVSNAPAEDRRLPIANWLAANLTTPESRQFLVRIQPLGGAQKADALDAEARRVGLPACNLAGEWRSPPTR